MKKAVLVIDMPKDCPACPVAHYNKLDQFTGCDIVGGKRYAITTEEGYKDTNYRPSWCPLKPMPPMSDVETIRIHMNAIKEALCNQGRWNEAQEYQNIVDKLDELLGEEGSRKKEGTQK